jgi:hypothetical protein
MLMCQGIQLTCRLSAFDDSSLHMRPVSYRGCQGKFMSTVLQAKLSKALPQRLQKTRPAKPAVKQQSSGLTREEIRQIVIDMIG